MGSASTSTGSFAKSPRIARAAVSRLRDSAAKVETYARPSVLEESGEARETAATEETTRQRRLEKSPAGTLGGPTGWRANPPVPLTIDRLPAHFLRLISCGERQVKPAICEVSGPYLRTSCLQSKRGRRNNSQGPAVL